MWELKEGAENPLLGKWHVGADELKRLWVGTFMTGYYRLVFDVDESISKKGELTLKAKFTDYLTGKVLTSQRIIK